jgi:glycosyltransferase involved in cell wall biosynthesis
LQTLFIIFLSAVGIQLIYLTLFLIALSKERIEAKRLDARIEYKPVSVIVCAHDEEQNLRELIPLLLEQKHPHFEIIIVNDRSNDGTYDFLLEETKKHPQLKMVHINARPNHVNAKKYAITLGIRAAKHDWIILTDSDCRPQSSAWLQKLSEACSDNTEIVLGYSPYQKEEGLLNLFIRFETLYTALQYVSYALLGNPYMGVGRNLAYRKSLFLNNKGFGDFIDVTGGDDDLFVNSHASAKNTVVVLGEQALVNSIPKKTISSFFFLKVRHLSTGKKYRFSHRLLLGIFTLSQIVTWVVGIPLLFSFSWVLWVLAAIVLRLIILTIAVYQASIRFGHKFELWAVPLLDFVFVIYYLSTAPVALLTKKLKWRS